MSERRVPLSVDPAMSAVADAAKRVDESEGGLERARQTTLDRRRALVRLLQGQGLLLVLVALIVVFWVSSPYFMVVANWSVIAQISALLGILAVSQTLLVVSGGIDISVGSTVACSCAMIGYLSLDHGFTILEACVVVLVGSALVGLVNGTIVVKLNVNPLVVTLGMYSILLGLAYTIVGTQSLPVSSSFFNFVSGQVGPVPWVFIIFAVFWGIGMLISHFTAVGRHIYAIGDNREAAERAGLHTNRIRIMLFVVSALVAGVVGILTTAQLSTSSPDVGSTYLLSVITVVVLGGTRLSGGRGGLFGTLIAIAILGVLQNGFALLQFTSFTQDIVLGFLLIAAVLVDQTTSRFERR